MDPQKPGAAALEMDSKPQPAYPPPVTGIPVGHTNHYINENPQYPHHQQPQHGQPQYPHHQQRQHGQPQYPHHQQRQHGQPQYPHHQQRQNAQQARWSSGLCDCTSDVPNCCLTCWCPCITFGRIAEIADKGTTPCAVSGAIYGVLMWLTCCSCLYSCLYRSKLRKEYMLEESPCNDCLVHCCCESCALCQEYRELKHRGFDMASGWQENLHRPSGAMAPSAPVVEQGMTR